jgi:hypothetical protein
MYLTSIKRGHQPDNMPLSTGPQGLLRGDWPMAVSPVPQRHMVLPEIDPETSVRQIVRFLLYKGEFEGGRRPRPLPAVPARQRTGEPSFLHGKQVWSRTSTTTQGKDPDREPRLRRRATYIRPHAPASVRRLRPQQGQALRPHQAEEEPDGFLEFCRYLRSLCPPRIRIAIVLDNFSPHLTTKKDSRVGDWASANNVELAYTPTDSSWLNRIEAQFTALRYFTLDGIDHASHKEQGVALCTSRGSGSTSVMRAR